MENPESVETSKDKLFLLKREDKVIARFRANLDSADPIVSHIGDVKNRELLPDELKECSLDEFREILQRHLKIIAEKDGVQEIRSLEFDDSPEYAGFNIVDPASRVRSANPIQTATAPNSQLLYTSAILKSRDVDALAFTVVEDLNSNSNVKIDTVTVLNKDALPLLLRGLKNDDLKRELLFFLSTRFAPERDPLIKELVKMSGSPESQFMNRFAFSLSTSLLDNFWVRPDQSAVMQLFDKTTVGRSVPDHNKRLKIAQEYDRSLTWENVNLYKNKFTDILVTNSVLFMNFNNFAKNFARRQNDPSFKQLAESDRRLLTLFNRNPGGTLPGGLPKNAIHTKSDKSIWMIRDLWEHSGLNKIPRSVCDIYLSDVAKDFFNGDLSRYVPYEPKRHRVQRKDDRSVETVTCAACKMFTDEDTGLISLRDLLRKRFPNKYSFSPDVRRIPKEYFKDGSVFDDIKTICDEIGPNEYSKFEDMMFFDALIMNSDRHLENIAFLIDNNTQKVKGLSPNFDSELSILYRMSHHLLPRSGGVPKEFDVSGQDADDLNEYLRVAASRYKNTAFQMTADEQLAKFLRPRHLEKLLELKDSVQITQRESLPKLDQLPTSWLNFASWHIAERCELSLDLAKTYYQNEYSKAYLNYAQKHLSGRPSGKKPPGP